MYDLTVILAIYNMQDHLARCLDSVLAQTRLETMRLRLLCIDDGSTDQTSKILAEYSTRYPWIEVHHKENGGVSSARNLGLDLVERSTYVTFLDPDDTWQPDYLEAVSRGMEAGKDTIFFNINLVDANGNLVKELEVCPEYRNLDAESARRRMILSKPASWTRVHRTELYEGNRFPVGRIYEDLALMPYVTSQSASIYYAPEYVYNYVIDVNNSIMNSSKSAIFDIYPALGYLWEKFGDSAPAYRDELQYLMLEHLGIGQTYRLLGYRQATAADYQRIIDTLRQCFGKRWRHNIYIRQGVQKTNVNSKLSLVIPQVFLAFDLGALGIIPTLATVIRKIPKSS